jgi:hypothetical protein
LKRNGMVDFGEGSAMALSLYDQGSPCL